MTSSRILIIWLSATTVGVLAGCASGPKNVVQESVKGIERGVKGIDRASGNLVGKLFTDRNRAQLVREHKDTREYLEEVEKFIQKRKIVTEKADDKLIQDAKDRLASIGRQLEAPRITSQAGLSMYHQLESVRQSLELIRERHNTPRYTGYIADR